MGTITATADQARGNIRVEVNWQDFPHTRKAWVYRVINGVRTLLREGNPVTLSNGLAVLYDTEMPLDTPITYRSLIALNENGDMEDGVAEYVGATTGATVAQSKDYYVVGEGVASLVATPTGAATVEIMSELVPVTVGVTYTFAGQVMIPRWWAGGVQLIARFYTAGLAIVSTIAPAADVTPPSGEWSSGSPHYSFGNSAPATSAFVRIGIRVSGTPPVNMPIYVDELYVTTGAGVVLSSPEVQLYSADGGWWRDPLHPANNVRLLMDSDRACAGGGTFFLGVAGDSRAADVSLNEVPGAAYPVGSFDTRKTARSSIVVFSRTLADKDRVQALHATGAPLQLAVPARYGVPLHYALHGDLEETRISGDMKLPARVLRAPTTQVKAPVGPNEGVLASRFMDLTKYATFGQASAAGGGAQDTFNRTAQVASWGTPTIGPAWTVNGTASWYSTSGSRGAYLMSTVGADRSSELALSIADFDITIGFISTSAAPATDNSEQRIRARYLNGSNFVEASIFRLPGAGVPTVRVRQFVAAVDTGSAFLPIVGATGASSFSLRFRGVGTALEVWAWINGTTQPATPTATFTTSFLAAGLVQLSAQLYGGVTNAPLTFEWDDIAITNVAGGPTWIDGLQGELTL